MAARKLVLQLGARGFNAFPISRSLRINKFRSEGVRSLSSDPSLDKYDSSLILQHTKPRRNSAFLDDTLSLVKGLEARCVPSKQAEAITSAIAEALNDCLENVAHSYASNVEMQKFEMLQEVDISKFNSGVQSSQHETGNLRNNIPEIEKPRNDIEKWLSELRQKYDKIDADHRLMMDEARTIIEAEKYDVIK